MDPEALLRLLVGQGWVDPADFQRLLEDYETANQELFDFLEASGVGSKDDVLKAVAESLGLETVDLKSVEFPRGLLECVPEDLSRIYRCVPIEDSADCLKLCLSDPLDDTAVSELRNHLARPIEVVIADPDVVEELVVKRLSGRFDTRSAFIGADNGTASGSVGSQELIHESPPQPVGASAGWFYAGALLALAAAATSAIYLQQRGTVKTTNFLVEKFGSLQEQADLEQLATERLTDELGGRLAEIERDLDGVSADAIRIAQLEAELRRLEGRLQALWQIIPDVPDGESVLPQPDSQEITVDD